MNELVDRIKKIMIERKMSASDLSKKINVQKSSISHILNGRNKPSLDFIVKLCNSFNDINLDWLINGKITSIPKLNSDFSLKNKNLSKRVIKIVLFYDDKSFDTYEGN
jgi:transcriptional regulator with XRE-family HTH domain